MTNINGIIEENYKNLSAADLDLVDLQYSGDVYIAKTVAASQYVADILQKYPEAASIIADAARSDNPSNPFSLEIDLTYNLETLKYEIRRYKHLSFCYIAVLAVNNIYTVTETIQELSVVADECLYYAADWSMTKAHSSLGKSYDSLGNLQKIIIIALGKLGGEELNFSSDIDICFVYPESVTFEARNTRCTKEDLYLHVARNIIDIISDNNEHGFVFRIDLKLRPFGDSGPIVLSTSSMEEYYQLYGREWERYALIKSRVVFGDLNEGRMLMQKLRPFIYRRYMDFSIFESLRDMRAMIEQEIRKKDKDDDIKIGRGGIRQIEFIAQSFQLVRGGKDPIFQQRSLIKALEIIKRYKYINEQEHKLLIESYEFLRKVENALQMLNNQQVHSLPKIEIDKKRLCVSLGFDNWEVLLNELNHYRNSVARLFNKILTPQVKNLNEGPIRIMIGDIWHNLNDNKSLHILEKHLPETYETVYLILRDFKNRINNKQLGQKTRGRIDKLLPEVINISINAPSPEQALDRLIALIESIGRRSLYISLMIENPGILQLIIDLCTKSEWVHQQLCKYPILLDELLDFRKNRGFSVADFKKELQLSLQWLDKNDLEQQMECLRQFKLNNTFRVAVSDVLGEISIKRVSDYLTDIAEVILEFVVSLAFDQVKNKLGFGKELNYLIDNFSVIAYGKLGGIELSYSSDLDLVFIYDAEQVKIIYGNEKEMSIDEFYMKLGQRMYHILNTTTSSGPLYNIDMRLRPLGDSGLLVTSFASFSDYQRNSAWTWEHQALVRARVVIATDKISRKLNSIRREILARRRVPIILKHDIASMRTRMQQERRNTDTDLKLMSGGINDIEFLVQYYVLRWSYLHPILTEHTDNMRIIDSLVAVGVLRIDDAKTLRDSYLLYRDINHKRILYGVDDYFVGDNDFLARKYTVESLWNNIFASYGDKIIKVGAVRG